MKTSAKQEEKTTKEELQALLDRAQKAIEPTTTLIKNSTKEKKDPSHAGTIVIDLDGNKAECKRVFEDLQSVIYSKPEDIANDTDTICLFFGLIYIIAGNSKYSVVSHKDSVKLLRHLAEHSKNPPLKQILLNCTASFLQWSQNEVAQYTPGTYLSNIKFSLKNLLNDPSFTLISNFLHLEAYSKDAKCKLNKLAPRIDPEHLKLIITLIDEMEQTICDSPVDKSINHLKAEFPTMFYFGDMNIIAPNLIRFSFISLLKLLSAQTDLYKTGNQEDSTKIKYYSVAEASGGLEYAKNCEMFLLKMLKIIDLIVKQHIMPESKLTKTELINESLKGFLAKPKPLQPSIKASQETQDNMVFLLDAFQSLPAGPNTHSFTDKNIHSYINKEFYDAILKTAEVTENRPSRDEFLVCLLAIIKAHIVINGNIMLDITNQLQLLQLEDSKKTAEKEAKRAERQLKLAETEKKKIEKKIADEQQRQVAKIVAKRKKIIDLLKDHGQQAPDLLLIAKHLEKHQIQISPELAEKLKDSLNNVQDYSGPLLFYWNKYNIAAQKQVPNTNFLADIWDYYKLIYSNNIDFFNTLKQVLAYQTLLPDLESSYFSLKLENELILFREYLQKYNLHAEIILEMFTSGLFTKLASINKEISSLVVGQPIGLPPQLAIFELANLQESRFIKPENQIKNPEIQQEFVILANPLTKLSYKVYLPEASHIVYEELKNMGKSFN